MVETKIGLKKSYKSMACNSARFQGRKQRWDCARDCSVHRKWEHMIPLKNPWVNDYSPANTLGMQQRFISHQGLPCDAKLQRYPAFATMAQWRWQPACSVHEMRFRHAKPNPSREVTFILLLVTTQRRFKCSPPTTSPRKMATSRWKRINKVRR
jgi:hypothetical protein